VIVVGSINVDLVVSAPRLPGPGETVLGGRFARHLGGKGANQAIAAARAGAQVHMVGAVGDDPNGRESVAALATEGVDVSGVRTLDAPSGVALIAVGPDGENLIVVAPGANVELILDDRSIVWPVDGGVLLASLEVPMTAVVAAAVMAAERGATIVINPAPAQPLPDELIALRPILTPNERELLVCGVAATPEGALATLQSRGAGPIVVTRGAAGALIADGSARTVIRGNPVEAVDTTGAGDTFAGVLAAWLASGMPLDEAVPAGNVAAGLQVGSAGARHGMPDRATIEAELNR
jgi:ribokinase